MNDVGGADLGALGMGKSHGLDATLLRRHYRPPTETVRPGNQSIVLGRTKAIGAIALLSDSGWRLTLQDGFWPSAIYWPFARGEHRCDVTAPRMR